MEARLSLEPGFKQPGGGYVLASIWQDWRSFNAIPALGTSYDVTQGNVLHLIGGRRSMLEDLSTNHSKCLVKDGGHVRIDWQRVDGEVGASLLWRTKGALLASTKMAAAAGASHPVLAVRRFWSGHNQAHQIGSQLAKSYFVLYIFSSTDAPGRGVPATQFGAHNPHKLLFTEIAGIIQNHFL